MWIAKSEGYGTVDETLSYVNRVAGEPSLEVDVDEYEFDFTGQRELVRDVGRVTEGIEVPIYPASDLNSLQTLEVITATDGEPQYNQTGDYRVQFMANPEDTSPALEFLARDTHWALTGVEGGDGPLEMTLTGYVNGGFVWNPLGVGETA